MPCNKTSIAVTMKFRLFEYYWIFSLGAFAIIIVMALFSSLGDWRILISILTLVVSFTFFLQKQKLDEMRMFKELFQYFNKEYDRLNDELNRIVKYGINPKKEDEDIQHLYDYFNLCAEEYLYYSKGYILPNVWGAWLNGMAYFHNRQEIRELWENELKSGSYYGFNLSEIQFDPTEAEDGEI